MIFFSFNYKNCQFVKNRYDTAIFSSFLNCIFAPVGKGALKILKSAAGMLFCVLVVLSLLLGNFEVLLL